MKGKQSVFHMLILLSAHTVLSSTPPKLRYTESDLWSLYVHKAGLSERYLCMHTFRDNMESTPSMKKRKKYSHIIQMQTLIYRALLCVHVKLFPCSCYSSITHSFSWQSLLASVTVLYLYFYGSMLICNIRSGLFLEWTALVIYPALDLFHDTNLLSFKRTTAEIFGS